MIQSNETLEDYLAKLNIEGSRDVWLKNRRKIDFILNQTRSYFKKAKTACDIGIGEGYLLKHLSGMGLEIIGIDISRYIIEYLKKTFEDNSIKVNLISEINEGPTSKIGGGD